MKTIEKCTLSDKELIEKAKELVSQLAKTGGKSWSLRVPVDFNNDPDMIFIELCKRLEDAQQQVSIAVEKALEITEREAWLIYHDGTTKANTHGQRQINIGNNHIKIDPLSIKTLVPQILKELKGELT